MKTSKFSILLLTSLIVTSCSTSITTQNTDIKSVNPSVNKTSNFQVIKLTKSDIAKLDKEYMSFSTKSLSAAYFQKKLVQLIGSDSGVTNGATIVRELQYAKYKTESVIPFQAMSAASPSFYTILTGVTAVVAQRSSDAPFDTFIGNSNPYPSAASGLNASTITTTSFSANWTAVTGATAYEISVDGAAPVNVGNVLTYAVSGLVAGSNHNFKVRVINGVGLTGPYSSTFSFILAPDAPATLTSSNITATSLSANWSAVTNATGYDISVDNAVPVTLGSVLTYSVTGLTPSTTHTFKVRALNNTLTGIYSATSGTITLLPAAPVATAATNINSTGFTANWTTVPSAASGYVITLMQGATTISTTPIASQATNNYVFTGLSTSTTYTYTVQAKNVSLSSTSSNSISATADFAVSTLSGNGIVGSSDNSVGTNATFNVPRGVAVNSTTGDVYVADFANHKIRKITPAGVVTTFAGSGSRGSDDLTGTSATFNYPNSLALDNSGNVYVADTNNNKIRKITPAGVVTTLAGSGSPGSDDLTGASATFNSPFGLTVDNSGTTVYVADSSNNKIRKIIISTGTVTTLAGSVSQGSADLTGTSATFNYPNSLALDNSGNVYVADTNNNKIRKITPAGAVTTLAGSGSPGSADNTVGTSATFNAPRGLTLDNSGNVYVADTNNNKIRKITPTGAVTTLAGRLTNNSGSVDGTGTNASFFDPVGLAVDSSGNIYVGDSDNNKIRKIQ